MSRCWLWAAGLALVVPPALAAQTFSGRVLDDSNDLPVATALIRLLDPEGEERAITAADSAGRYRLAAPGVGVYRVVAERLGYEPSSR